MKLLPYSICIILSLLYFYSSKGEYTLQDPLQESIKRGADIYSDFCVTCHLPSGEGVDKVYPPLAQSDYLFDYRKESIHGIKYGQQGEIVVNGKKYNGVMAPLGLSDDEVADVMNYILNSWGNSCDKMVTEEEVASIKK